MDGWASLQTESGYVILESFMRPTKYKVSDGEQGAFVMGEGGRMVDVEKVRSGIRSAELVPVCANTS